MSRLDMIITDGQKDAIDTVSETLEALDEEISRSGEMRGWESVGKRVPWSSSLG